MQPKIFPPVFMLLFAVVMWLLDRYFPGMEVISEPWSLIGYGFIAGALLIDLWSLLLFLRAKTTFHPLQTEKTSTLVTNGMYRVTRNPMYLGLLLLLIGWAMLLGTLTPFLMLPLFVWVINSQQIQHEELVLEEKFGDLYLEYKQKVRRWL